MQEKLFGVGNLENLKNQKMNKTDRIYIAGHNGMVGSAIIRELKSEGYENLITKKLKSVITNTPVGNISEPILLPNGILVFKVRNKRKVERNIDLEEVKNELVNSEKTRILNMHSSSHYNNLRRSISIKFF